MKKIAIITGTSSGLGLETAVQLAKEDFTVYATMRNLSKKDALLKKATASNVQLKVLKLDVTDQSSIDDCITTVIEAEGKIDLLVNNAGSGFAKTTEQVSEDELNWVTDVNYFGVVRCTKAVLPYMRKQKSGHIVNITSVGGLVGQPFNEFYCAAKFAVEGYTEALATYVSDAFDIKFSIVEPGGIISEFMNSAVEKTLTDGLLTHPDYAHILEKYMTGVQERAKEDGNQVYQTAEEVANVVLEVVNATEPPLRVRTSQWAENFAELKTKADQTGNLLVNQVKEQFLS